MNDPSFHTESAQLRTAFRLSLHRLGGINDDVEEILMSQGKGLSAFYTNLTPFQEIRESAFPVDLQNLLIKSLYTFSSIFNTSVLNKKSLDKRKTDTRGLYRLMTTAWGATWNTLKLFLAPGIKWNAKDRLVIKGLGERHLEAHSLIRLVSQPDEGRRSAVDDGGFRMYTADWKTGVVMKMLQVGIQR